MSDWIIYTIGFTAQILFSARLLFQWILSEKNKKSVTPVLFWKLSLLASFLLFVYGYFREDFAIMFGQTLTYFIYIRNLQLQGQWQKLHRFFRIFLFIFPVLIVIYSFNNNEYDLHKLFNNDAIPLWLLLLGAIAQLVFTLRFVYQWIYSERKKESTLPLGFWVISLIGSSLILSYAIIRKDPVLLAGHLFGAVVYIRNIFLHRNEITK
ncbi:MAG: lauroyl acyltransferase [Flavobacteriaceae bacterium CG_4_8_14_3_um_filter_34_10]|nr:lauroyl acyltransferase [Flavobacteriia bacterium]OIP52470.1 MAG: lauroyl acyltransferase [Flavobacteriaceae bacterium CG2_30_34_30]PIQ17937.1 MAG: lauroyl acyltransferase [Flavobacteriaceae bacterium CG18_big_fil_WC_8_21_14_2_50_34_36]PIV51616.1 MAG: lauroyl acyltransferase [Flavobacteriaceae bacterium CG02_land_8_20_14_3_00_34_13]PIX09021.1 MAG: lauroyl acyltransferase [Flavobacteriaceae bacterium CG_4_8_14_3_um_filter_34_10]PIZ07231.1 MAG: lauroyl acyltransferase [Flavobacteriaceae bacte